MAGDLLRTIPIIPQSAAKVQTPKAAPPQPAFVEGSKLEYPAAYPISPAVTRPQGVGPISPSGRLIHENIFQSAASTVKSYTDYVKYFYKAAFKGEGSDYTVGKINDLAIRAGSLGIAGTLFATKLFPFARGMEFVGLGTWFASMALWPKIMNIPIKMKTGVDPGLKYIDSYGRRKSFYEDPGYMPFDMFRHIDKNGKYNEKAPDYERLDAIGDKLGIPRNIENRHEAIKNKMRQVAVQSNTLWMLTAGFMTPVLSSIAADALQKPLADKIQKYRVNKAETELTTLISNLNALNETKGITTEAALKKLGIEIDSAIEKQFEAVNKNTLNPKEAKAFREFFNSRYYEQGLGTGINSEFASGNIISKGNIKITSELENKLVNLSEEIINKFIDNKFNIQSDNLTKVEELYRKAVPDFKGDFASLNIKDVIEVIKNEQKIIRHTENKKLVGAINNFSGTTVAEFKQAIASRDLKFFKIPQFSEFKAFKQVEIQAAIREAISAVSESGVLTPKSQLALIQSLAGKYSWDINERGKLPSGEMERLQKIAADTVAKYFEENRSYKVDVAKARSLFKISEINLHLFDKMNRYKRVTIQNIRESITARNWETLPQEYVKAIGFTSNELKLLSSLDTNTAERVLIKRFDELVKNPEQYAKAIKKMSKLAENAITKEEKAFINLVGTMEKPGLIDKIQDLTMSMIDMEIKSVNLKTFWAKNYKVISNKLSQKFNNTVDSFIKPIKALDLFKYLQVQFEDVILEDGTKLTKIKNPEQIHPMIKKLLGVDSKEFVKKIRINKDNRDNIIYPFHQGFEKQGAYKKAVNALIGYIKDSAVQKNDINNWTTKSETNISGYPKCFKHSLGFLNELAKTIFGEVTPDTAQHISPELLNKINIKNTEMYSRFMRIDNKLLDHANFKNNAPIFEVVEKFFNMTQADVTDANGNIIKTIEEEGKKILQLLETRKAELRDNKEFENAINAVKGYIDHLRKGAKYEDKNPKFVANMINIRTANKNLGEMAGKNIVDLFADAGRNIRSRNKWLKTVWGIFGITAGISALFIANIGKRNFYNNEKYITKEEDINANK